MKKKTTVKDLIVYVLACILFNIPFYAYMLGLVPAF